MYEIPLQAVPNQRFSVRLEGALFDVTIKAARTVVTATIVRDGITLVQGVRCLPGTALIPHRYLEDTAGNFMFLTDGDKYPDYTRFSTKDRLMYLTRTELDEVRNG